MLTTEGLLRLYHETVKRDILYFDATGLLTLESKEYKRILHYILCVRHPNRKTPSLPIGHFITSSHSVESIKSFLMTLQEKKELVFGVQAMPRLLLTDYSLALILASLRVFSKETLKQYINRTFRIIKGTASDTEANSMLVHICYSHTVNAQLSALGTYLKF